jgi:hypothetical protein
MMEQERIENSSKDEVTKVERKNIAKPTIFDKTNPLPEGIFQTILIYFVRIMFQTRDI